MPQQHPANRPTHDASSGTGGGGGATKKRDGITGGSVGGFILPTIRHWTYDEIDGTISGYVGGSRLFPDDVPVTTSRIVNHSRRSRPSVGSIVQTRSGTRYVLGGKAVAGGGGGEAITTATITTRATTSTPPTPNNTPPPPNTTTTKTTMGSLEIWGETWSNRTTSFLLNHQVTSLRSRPSCIESWSRRRYYKLIALSLCIAIIAIASSSTSTNRYGGNVIAGSSFGADADGAAYDTTESSSRASDRERCQIVYVLGVEGSVHHGVTPILRSLASHVVDDRIEDGGGGKGRKFEVTYADRRLRSALFGFNRNTRSMDHPGMVRHTMRQLCPNDGARHVILEDLSFPSGESNDARTYRIHRQKWWYQSTMEQIAMSETALNHPMNLDVFYEAYSPYADIRFVVLHRPYIETIASHADHDGNAEQHSNVLRGFMLLIRRFLDAHANDTLAPGGRRRRTWTLVCVERLMSSYYGGDETARDDARRRITAHLANFLGWDHALEECNDCFDGWVESNKDHVSVLGGDNIGVLLEHMRKLGGIWPPEVEDALPEQKCSL